MHILDKTVILYYALVLRENLHFSIQKAHKIICKVREMAVKETI